MSVIKRNLSKGNSPDVKIKIALIGLDGAGKTAIVHKLLNIDILKKLILPTTLINFERISTDIIDFMVLDSPGQVLFRDQWQEVITEANLVCYVIDASNSERLDESIKEFNERAIPNISTKTIVILSNKQDLKLTKKVLNKEELKSHFRAKAKIIETSAITGEGLLSLQHEIKNNFSKN